ncbi:hypothetical protein U0839_05070 [Commensalibacter sp. A3DC]
MHDSPSGMRTSDDFGKYSVHSSSNVEGIISMPRLIERLVQPEITRPATSMVT